MGFELIINQEANINPVLRVLTDNGFRVRTKIVPKKEKIEDVVVSDFVVIAEK